ncbi:MAG: hypothetical protein ACJ76N_16415 [Thermoanaerobaculia bacterium]
MRAVDDWYDVIAAESEMPPEARAAADQASRIRPETLQRIGDLAKYVLDVLS